MMRSQLLTGHVLEPRVLEALMGVVREDFVPPAVRGAAYVDDEIRLAPGRVLMEPLTFARMLIFAGLTGGETVLDVGCATGYSAAVLARITQKVVALEEDAALAAIAKSTLASVPNVSLVTGPLPQGVSREAPYDVIFIEGAVEILPQALADQLREGGRLLAVVREAEARTASSGLGRLVEYRKVRGVLYASVLMDAAVPLLASFARPATFTL